MGSLYGPARGFPSQAVRGGGGYPLLGPTLEQQVQALFAQGQPGGMWDFTDLATLRQTTTEGVPVAATGEVIGIALDKRLALGLGAEALQDGNFATGAPWAAPVAGASITGGQLAFDGVTSITNGVAITSQSVAASVTVGQIVTVTYTITADTIGFISVGFNGGSSGTARRFPGTYSDTFVASGTTLTIFARVATGARSGGITSVSVRVVEGNHLSQATAGLRPIFREVAGRRYSEFDGVDDYLRALFAVAQPMDRVSSFRQISWTNADRIFGGGSANSGILLQSSASPIIGLFDLLATQPFVLDMVIGETAVIRELHDGAASAIAKNSGAASIGNPGTAAADGVTVGANNNNLNPANAAVTRIVMRGSTTPMTPAEIAICQAWCAQGAGVIL